MGLSHRVKSVSQQQPKTLMNGEEEEEEEEGVGWL
jgi:hypothetical protein